MSVLFVWIVMDDLLIEFNVYYDRLIEMCLGNLLVMNKFKIYVY